MKRYRQQCKVCWETMQAETFEDPEGEWVKWEDLPIDERAALTLIRENKSLRDEIKRLKTGQGVKDPRFNSHDGYIRTKYIATGMDVSLHQVFFADAATLRFKTKDGESIIVDVDMGVFENFIKTNSTEETKKSNEQYWICPAHGYKKR